MSADGWVAPAAASVTGNDYGVRVLRTGDYYPDDIWRFHEDGSFSNASNSYLYGTFTEHGFLIASMFHIEATAFPNTQAHITGLQLFSTIVAIGSYDNGDFSVTFGSLTAPLERPVSSGSPRH